MKINEVLTEAGVLDTLKAIASNPKLLANPGNIEAAANQLRNNRDVAELAGQMAKVWQNTLDQKRKQLQSTGMFSGKIADDDYQDLLKDFISRNILGGNKTNAGLDRIVTAINKAANDNNQQQYGTLFKDLITQGLMIRAMSTKPQNQQTDTSTSTPQQNSPKTVNAVKDALQDAKITDTDLNQLKAAISSLGISQAIRTNDPTTRSLLQALGIPVS